MMTYTLPSGSKSICNQEKKKIKKSNLEWLPKQVTAPAGDKKFPNLTKSRCRQDTLSTNRASLYKEALRTLHPHWNKKCVHTWKVRAQWISHFKHLKYCSNIYLHHYCQESQKVPQLSNFLTAIYTEPRYGNVETKTVTARQISSGHRSGKWTHTAPTAG